MKIWIVYTIVAAIFIGIFNCAKKKATEKSSVTEVLAWMTLTGLLITSFISKDMFNIATNGLFLVLVKSIAAAASWFLGIYAISKVAISLYSVINLSKIIFTIMLGIIFFSEKLTLSILIGIIMVITGLILVNNVSKEKENKKANFKIILIILLSCFFSSISAIIDKEAMKIVTTSQLHFWFLFFLTLICWAAVIIKKQKISIKSIWQNYWILIAAITLILSDHFLFTANQIPESQVSVMALLKQVSAIEGIILGKIVFKEKNIIKKLLCSVIAIWGIVLILF